MLIPLAIAGSVGVAAALTSTFLPGPGLHDWLVPGAIWRLASRGVVLTFDDGPHPERTPLVLDILGRFGVRAVFFVVGERAAREPRLIRRISAEGHELGNHSWSHRSMALVPRAQIRDELTQCQKAIESIVGVTPRFARPPWGRRDYRFYQEARLLHLTPMLWSLDSGDWLGLDAVRIARRVDRAGQGDVVLFHDGAPRARGLVPGLSAVLQQWRGSLPIAVTGANGEAPAPVPRVFDGLGPAT